MEFKDIISIANCYLWTDSAVALSWVEKGQSVGAVFVANRVHEILMTKAERRWVPGTTNPADLRTRGMTITELKESYLWWNGPNWLGLGEEHWPQSCTSIIDSLPSVDVNGVVKVAVSVKPTLQWLTELVDPTRTSQWKHTLRSLCWMLRWKGPSQSISIQPAELKFASKLIYRQVQRKFFPGELLALENGEDISRKSVLYRLHPFLHESLLRMGGRLQQCMATYDEKHPVLLKRCGVIDQLVLDVHEHMQHGGASFVISELRRQGVWILCPRKSASSVIRTCRKCRKFIAAPAAEVTAPFPHSRVSITRVFDTTGMDLGGPLHLRNGSKVWFVLFTCMSVRAIHLELVLSASEEAFQLSSVSPPGGACRGSV